MAYEQERVVTSQPVTEPAVEGERVVEQRTVAPAQTVVEQPVTRVIRNDDVVGNAYAASNLIQTVVWSVVVIVLLVVLLVALHVYAGLF